MAKGKPAPKGGSMKKILLFGALGLIVFFALPSEDAPAKRTAKKPVRRSSSTVADIFVPADYTTRFPALAEPVKDAFKPAVFRPKSAATAAAPTPSKVERPGGFPVDLASGEANWIYTGLATIDDATLGLLENSATGQGDFVKPGQAWKTSTIISVAPEFIVMRDPKGALRTIKVGRPEPLPAETAVAAGGAIAPPITGPIGRVEIQPLPAPGAVTAAPSSDPNTRRRGRRARQNQQGTPDAN